MMEPSEQKPVNEFEELNNAQSLDEDSSEKEILESMLERTRHVVESDGYHAVLTDYVRENRLPSKFSFENLSELVRCVIGGTNIDRLPIDKEECINWIANYLFEDPVANARAETLWNSIVSRLQA